MPEFLSCPMKTNGCIWSRWVFYINKLRLPQAIHAQVDLWPASDWPVLWATLVDCLLFRPWPRLDEQQWTNASDRFHKHFWELEGLWKAESHWIVKGDYPEHRAQGTGSVESRGRREIVVGCTEPRMLCWNWCFNPKAKKRPPMVLKQDKPEQIACGDL